MRLTGKDVWEAGTKMGWANGTYDPRTNGIAALASHARIASSLSMMFGNQFSRLLITLLRSEAITSARAKTKHRSLLIRLPT